MVVTVAIRSPATMVGSAIGSCTRQSSCHGPYPIPLRRLDHVGRHAANPVTMLRIMIRSV